MDERHDTVIVGRRDRYTAPENFCRAIFLQIAARVRRHARGRRAKRLARFFSTQAEAIRFLKSRYLDPEQLKGFLVRRIVGFKPVQQQYLSTEIRRQFPSLDSALEFINCKSVYTYDSLDEKWIRYIPGFPELINTLTHLKPGKAYWIYVTEDDLWYID